MPWDLYQFLAGSTVILFISWHTQVQACWWNKLYSGKHSPCYNMVLVAAALEIGEHIVTKLIWSLWEWDKWAGDSNSVARISYLSAF